MNNQLFSRHFCWRNTFQTWPTQRQGNSSSTNVEHCLFPQNPRVVCIERGLKAHLIPSPFHEHLPLDQAELWEEPREETRNFTFRRPHKLLVINYTPFPIAFRPRHLSWMNDFLERESWTEILLIRPHINIEQTESAVTDFQPRSAFWTLQSWH